MKFFIDNAKCTGCGKCVEDCIAEAIDPADMVIDADKCMECSHCYSICPVAAVSCDAGSGCDIHSIEPGAAAVFENMMLARRSVRRYKPELITRTDVERLLKFIKYSPTGTNSFKVGVCVVNSFEKMKEFTDMAMKFFRFMSNMFINPLTYPFIILFGGGLKGLRRLLGYKKYISKYFDGKNILTHDAPALFVFYAADRSSTPADDGIIASVQTAFHAQTLGVGYCYNGFLVRGLRFSGRLRRYLGIPAGCRVYSVFTAGYPVHTYLRSAVREDLKY